MTIHEFIIKWQPILTHWTGAAEDHQFAEDCWDCGFEMDRGESFVAPAQRKHHNAVATILYNTHIIGDYVEGKAHTQAAMQPLKDVVADTIKHGVMNFDCSGDLKEQFKKEMWKAYNSSGAVKNKAEAILKVMTTYIPKCVDNSKVIKRIVWGDMKPSSVASEDKPQAAKK